jgi:succinate-acetate transporter protein
MFWAVIQLPGTGILAAYTGERELGHALGIILITWFIVTLMFMYAQSLLHLFWALK